MSETLKKVAWLNTTDGTIGVVKIDNGFEVKSYIKQVRGDSENEDIIDIYENGARFPNEAMDHLMGFDEDRPLDSLRSGTTSTNNVPTLNGILENSDMTNLELPMDLFDLSQDQIEQSKGFYGGKVIKCLVAPYHTAKQIKEILPYSKSAFVYPEDEMSIEDVKRFVSIIVNSPTVEEAYIITKNQNIIMDMIDGCVRVLTEGGDIVPSPTKTLMANIHSIRHELLENEAHQISEKDKTNSVKYIETIIEVLNNKQSVTQEERNILKGKIDLVGEDIIKSSLDDMLRSLPNS